MKSIMQSFISTLLEATGRDVTFQSTTVQHKQGTTLHYIALYYTALHNIPRDTLCIHMRLHTYIPALHACICIYI